MDITEIEKQTKEGADKAAITKAAILMGQHHGGASALVAACVMQMKGAGLDIMAAILMSSHDVKLHETGDMVEWVDSMTDLWEKYPDVSMRTGIIEHLVGVKSAYLEMQRLLGL